MLKHEILQSKIKPIKMHCDNKGAVDMAHNNNVSEKTKHIDIKLKFVHFDLERKKNYIGPCIDRTNVSRWFNKGADKRKTPKLRKRLWFILSFFSFLYSI